jgi:hypothetical protein
MEISANLFIAFALSLRAIPPWRESVAIRRSRCEGEVRGNLKSSFALLRTRLRRPALAELLAMTNQATSK